MTNSPTVKRRRLSAALRQHRIDAGLSAAEAAKRLDWDPSKVARMERNQWKRPDLRDIKDLLDLYGVADERRREALLTLARDSRQRGWWANYQDIFRTSLPEFESGASVIWTYECLVIPGLLQIAEYAGAVFRAGEVVDDKVIERRVEARMARQELLTREGAPSLIALIDEAALLKLVGGPEVMQKQLRHLIAMASRPNVRIQVVPNSAGAHKSLAGSFVILDFPSPSEDPSLVYLETPTDSLWLEKPEEHRRYTLIFNQVQGLALSADESVQRLAALVDQLKR